jgi:MFS transporter, ACS family, tartrate transporter
VESERAVMTKIMIRVLPVLVASALISMIDRANVGFAALGMNSDIGLSSTAFGFGAGIFFVTYVLFEIPSNIVLVKVGARKWIARIMLSWGIVSGATAFVTGPTSFYILRALLGIAEAGFIPGVLYYLTLWTPSAYRGRITGILMMAMPAAFIVGSPLSGLLLGLNDVAGMRGWQWVFVLEATPAVVLAVLIYLFLPDEPHSAEFLKPNERIWLTERIELDRAETYQMRAEIDDGPIDQKRSRVVVLGAILFCISIVNYGLGFFFPQIVKGFGLTDLQTGFVTTIPYIIGLGAVVGAGLLADKLGSRRNLLISAFLVAGGFLFLSSWLSGPLAKLVTFSIAALGMFGSIPAFWAYMSDVLGPSTGNSTATKIAVVNAIANVSGFLGPFIMGFIRDRAASFDGSVIGISSASVFGVFLVFYLGGTTAENHNGTAPGTY